MKERNDEIEHRVSEVERRLTGTQRQVSVLHSRFTQQATESSGNLGKLKAQVEKVCRQHERRIRDLEIQQAVLVYNLPQHKVAEDFKLSQGRVSQIVNSVRNPS